MAGGEFCLPAQGVKTCSEHKLSPVWFKSLSLYFDDVPPSVAEPHPEILSAQPITVNSLHSWRTVVWELARQTACRLGPTVQLVSGHSLSVRGCCFKACGLSSFGCQIIAKPCMALIRLHLQSQLTSSSKPWNPWTHEASIQFPNPRKW